MYDQNTNTELNLIIIELNNIKEPNNSDLLSSARKTLRLLINEKNVNTELLKEWIRKFSSENQFKYCNQKVKEMNLESQVKFKLMDYRELKEKFEIESGTEGWAAK